MKWLNYYEVRIKPGESLADAVKAIDNVGGGTIHLSPGNYCEDDRIVSEKLEDQPAKCDCCKATLNDEGRCYDCIEHECSCRMQFMNEDDWREDR